MRYAVLAYSEGELPIPINNLPAGIIAGSQLEYSPSDGQYVKAGKKARNKKSRGKSKKSAR